MRLVMMGTGTFAEPTFEALLRAFPSEVVGLVTQPDRDGAKLRGSSRQTGKGMAAIAVAAGVPVIQPVSINQPDGLAAFQALRPDLCVVAAYGQILSRAVIETPPVGMVNVHASLLPKYRGASPIAHAILAGETVTGVTILRVVPGLDAGDILERSAPVKIKGHTTGSLEDELAEIGAQLLVKVVRRMQTGPVTGEKQDPELVTRAPKFKKEDGLIDWTEPAEVIERKVRAFQPWPTAYTFLHEPGKPPQRFTIIEAEVPVEKAQLLDVDGIGSIRVGSQLAEVHPDLAALPGGMIVRTGGNSEQGFWLRVNKLQRAGGRPMSAIYFLNGWRVAPGSRFGPEVLS